MKKRQEKILIQEKTVIFMYDKKYYKSESGIFVCDENNSLLEFYPSMHNLTDNKEIEHLIIPEGVERIERENFFAHRTLKMVIIPESVVMMNDFAFGNSNIDILCLSEKYMYTRHYGRQFKCATVNRLFIPEKFYIDSQDPCFFGQFSFCRGYFEFHKVNKTFVYSERESGKLPKKFIEIK